MTYSFRSLTAAMFLAPLAATAQDGTLTTEAMGSVDETVAALTSAIEDAGANVFAVVDHGAGAESVGEDIGDMQLVIFGNPAIGTPAIIDAPLAGLHLPLKVLVYEDEGGTTRMAWENPEAMLAGLGLPDGADYLGKMSGALEKLTGAAR